MQALKSGLFADFQSVPQTTYGNTISSGPLLPPHHPFPTYSQPSLPRGPLTSMFGSPIHPPSLAYRPFSGNSSIHQSPTTLHMKYGFPRFRFKSSMHPNGLPHSLPVDSSYGGFGGSTNIPGAFLQSPSNVAVGSTFGYEEALRSYKGSVPLHQVSTTVRHSY